MKPQATNVLNLPYKKPSFHRNMKPISMQPWPNWVAFSSQIHLCASLTRVLKMVRSSGVCTGNIAIRVPCCCVRCLWHYIYVLGELGMVSKHSKFITRCWRKRKDFKWFWRWFIVAPIYPARYAPTQAWGISKHMLHGINECNEPVSCPDIIWTKYDILGGGFFAPTYSLSIENPQYLRD